MVLHDDNNHNSEKRKAYHYENGEKMNAAE